VRYMRAVGADVSLPSLGAAERVPYPSLTTLGGTPSALSSVHTTGKLVHFEPTPEALEPELAIPQIVAALRAGARVLIVMNTVGRANALHRCLASHPDVSPEWLFSC